MKRSILFLCTANSIRSQMARALLEQLSQDFIAHSAGILPTCAVDIQTVRVLHEIGIDASSYRPLDIEQFRHIHLDILITMSGTAYRDCPAWLYENPSAYLWALGLYRCLWTEPIGQFRKLRNQIEAHLRAFLAEYRPELTRDELAALVRRFTR
jgi:arsenate reductase